MIPTSVRNRLHYISTVESDGKQIDVLITFEVQSDGTPDLMPTVERAKDNEPIPKRLWEPGWFERFYLDACFTIQRLVDNLESQWTNEKVAV